MRTPLYDMRKSGIPAVGELPWGSHLCQLYGSQSDLLEVLVPYFRAGLENNELCLWAVHVPLSVEAAREALSRAVPDLPEYLRSGQMQIQPGAAWAVSESEAGRAIVARLDHAVTKDYDGLRLACRALSRHEGDPALTAAGLTVIAPLNVIALYLYPRECFDAVGLMDVVKRHRLALIRGAGGWEVLESSETLSDKDALKLAEEKLHSLFNNMSEGFAYHRIVLDAEDKPCDYVFLEINEAFSKITGLEADQIIGKRVTTALPGIERDPTDWIGKYGRVALTGEPLQFESHAEPLDRWYAVSAFSPRKGFFACTFADITERKRTEAERYALQERLAVTLRSIGDAVVSTDAEGRITFLNPVAVALTGWNESLALGRPASEVIRIVDETSGAPDGDLIGRVLREKCVIEVTNHAALVSRDGRQIPIEDSAAPICNSEGQIAGAVLVFHDVTSKRRALQALQRSHEELEERVARRTEQLRNANLQIEARAVQLRALAGELTLAEQRERRRIAMLLHDNLQQLLVGAKFRVSALERSPDADTRQSGAAINALLDEAIQSSRSLTAEISPPILYDQGLAPALRWLVGWLAQKHGLAVEINSEPIPAGLAEDMNVLLFESVREILFNIVKHAGVREARVDIRCADGILQIAVTDRGRGFEHDSARAAAARGGGFGLFSIRERLGLLGGEVSIHSALGHGTCVTLSAPVSLVSPLQAYGPSRQVRVLVVDDHPVMREGLMRLLSNEPDMEVVGEASDGHAAIDFATRLNPDVVLMDVNMPGMGGIESTRLIRSRLPHVKVVGLSMMDGDEVSQAMLAAGASAHLSKGGATGDIVSAIRACMQKARGVESG